MCIARCMTLRSPSGAESPRDMARPAYLAAHGRPRTSEEFARTAVPTRSVQGRYVCNNGEVLREWALAGLGIALKSTWDVYRQPPTWRSTAYTRIGVCCRRKTPPQAAHPGPGCRMTLC